MRICALIPAAGGGTRLGENAFANSSDADTVESWLKAHGAKEIERFPDNDILLSVN